MRFAFFRKGLECAASGGFAAGLPQENHHRNDCCDQDHSCENPLGHTESGFAPEHAGTVVEEIQAAPDQAQCGQDLLPGFLRRRIAGPVPMEPAKQASQNASIKSGLDAECNKGCEQHRKSFLACDVQTDTDLREAPDIPV